MLEILQHIFDWESFIPHGHCYLWKPMLVWLHVVSDSLIALAYYCIPLLLIYIVRKRGDLPFDWVFMLFGSFIIACGTGHISDVWTLWYPTYWLSGMIKALTAVISVATAIVLVSLIPKILAIPSPAQLTAANHQLEREIRERQQVEAQLRGVNQQLTFHMENSPLAVVEWNNEFRVQRWSTQAEKMFGWTAEEVINRHPSEWAFIFADDVESVNQTMQGLANSGKARNITYNRNYTQNGSFIHCEWYNSALFDESGRLISILSLVLDVTERVVAEEAVKSQQKFLREVIDTDPNLIFVKDWKGKFLLVNQAVAQVYGTSVDNLIGKTDADFNPNPEEVERFLMADQQVMTTRQEKLISEETVTDSTGHIRWFQTIKKPLVSSASRALSLLGVATDITERKQIDEALRQSEAVLRAQAAELEKTLQELKSAQTQLIQSEKMSSLGQLVAGVAHEINNPVNFIYGNLVHASEYTQNLLQLLHLYQQNYPEPAPNLQIQIERIDLDFLVQDLPKMLSSMKLGADRIRQIVLSLRNFSRLDEAEVKAVNIHEGIDSTLLILQSRLKQKVGYPAIELIKEYGNLPLVECYAGQLNQVFMNILTNAIDALDEYNKSRSLEEAKQNPSRIRIYTEVQGRNQAVIRITDNGPGMSEETRRRLFDPFFTTKQVGAGTGLGLSISYQIVAEKHGGQLRCHSVPGQGAEFIIEIPVHQLQRRSAEVSA